MTDIHKRRLPCCNEKPSIRTPGKQTTCCGRIWESYVDDGWLRWRLVADLRHKELF